jgi:hypothetical protein
MAGLRPHFLFKCHYQIVFAFEREGERAIIKSKIPLLFGAEQKRAQA